MTSNEALFTAEQLPPSSAERRASDRARLIIEIHFDGADATGVAHTRDISSGGLYMNTQREIAEGVLIKLRIPLSRDRMIVVDAQVIYSNPGHGVGVRFVNLSAVDRDTLQSILPQL